MRLDVAIGMALSQLIVWSVITTTSGSLHTHGITDIRTAAQAALSTASRQHISRIFFKNIQKSFLVNTKEWLWCEQRIALKWSAIVKLNIRIT
jgi:hypothetical protein